MDLTIKLAARRGRRVVETQANSKVLKISLSVKSPELIQRVALNKTEKQSYQAPITARIWDAQLLNGIIVGRVHAHINAQQSARLSNGSIIQTKKIQHIEREGEFWVIDDARDFYVIATFRDLDGENQLLNFADEIFT